MNNTPVQTLDLTQIKKKLSEKKGPEYWRTFEEIAETPEFREVLKREFPQEPAIWDKPMKRRDFMKLMGSLMVMAGFAGCARQPDEKIVPYVKAPENIVPGRPLFFATAATLAGDVFPVLAESHMGRPTRIEGNPEHPSGAAGADIFAQSSILSLYDPDRSKKILHRGQAQDWAALAAALKAAVAPLTRGKGLALVTPKLHSPALVGQLEKFFERYPEARLYRHEAVSSSAVTQGIYEATGERLELNYDLKEADVIVSIDADFLSRESGHLVYARQFADRRRMDAAQPHLNRLYVIEPSPSLTGSMADHRLPLEYLNVGKAAIALAKELGLKVASDASAQWPAGALGWIKAAAKDLAAHKGRSLVIAGSDQPAWVHSLAFAMNAALGNVGRTVKAIKPLSEFMESFSQDLSALVNEAHRGAVKALVIFDVNLMYETFGDLNTEDALRKIPFKMHWGAYENETSDLCDWHVPAAHYLESWSDARTYDGHVSLVQPLIAPLFGAYSVHEVMAALAGEPGLKAHDIVKNYWKGRFGGLDFNAQWQRWLHDGWVGNVSATAVSASLKGNIRYALDPAEASRGPEIVFKPDPTVWDGTFANNPWLQELPKPLSKVSWENVAWVSPDLGEGLGLKNGDEIEITIKNQSIKIPAWIMPGQASKTVSLFLGYGRRKAGRIGTGIGTDVNILRSSKFPYALQGAQIRKTGFHHKLASTQEHHQMHNRHLVRSADWNEYRQNPEFAKQMAVDPEPHETLYPEAKKGVYAWGMNIDLNTCIGCNACVIACQSENNIPVVGKTEVTNYREMQWIRIDRYFKGDLDNPEIVHQPVTCMHCENAPCEPVCPVEATNHSEDGLNQMVYNRCIGTRYCSNNCPYKVRRFNFYNYMAKMSDEMALLMNPDVTVRSRGVMEKCTYCVQRINEARIQSEKENRKIRDGEIVTACQSACPSKAIRFGDLNDPKSEVSRLKASPLNYGLLTELNTRPHTTYLARVRNPNPELEKQEGVFAHHG